MNHYQVRNYTRKHIERDYFIEIIDDLSRNGTPITLDDLIKKQIKNEHHIPDNAFAVTFDDGFENNYSIVAPILKERNIPATFYTTTDFIENNRMVWVDQIEWCLEETPTVEIQLPWENRSRRAEKAEEKVDLLKAIRNHLKSCTQNFTLAVSNAVSAVYEACNLPLHDRGDDPLDQKMNWDQVIELHQESLFEIGGHTHNHFILSYLTEEEMKLELSHSIQQIETKLGTKINHYAYPEGLKKHYNQNVIDELKKLGIQCCPSAEDGVTRHDGDLFHLPRITVT